MIKRLVHYGKRILGLSSSYGGFTNSSDFWEKRYKNGGSSGPGSYDVLAEFKAKTINDLLRQLQVHSMFELGCGDGNQLSMFQLPHYTGVDVSPTVIEKCKKRFKDDPLKRFVLLDEFTEEHFEMGLSLDVIYHLIEDDVYHTHLDLLFERSKRFVLIYSSNEKQHETTAPHVKHRKFTDDVANRHKKWALVKHIPNEHPFQGDFNTGSSADFYLFARVV